MREGVSPDHDKNPISIVSEAFKTGADSAGNSGFVPAIARWVIERSNALMERCKILVKHFEQTLANATAKINLGFVRLMLKRLATSP